MQPTAGTPSNQPDELAAIRSLRPSQPSVRCPGPVPSASALQDRILGALLGRAAGCILGIPPEGMSKAEIAEAAGKLGQAYPLDDYWRVDPKQADPDTLHYGATLRRDFLYPSLNHIGADDDLAYTLLGLLILEEYGFGFTSEHVGQAWLKYLPMACTAEDVALKNLKQGLKPPATATTDNPYSEWIGADIRSDPWGYGAAGRPELAAELAWRDARVSHTRNGIYGAMFFSAVIAAAFACNTVEEAIAAGLGQIPARCDLADMIHQTLGWCAQDGDWETTTERILDACKHMSGVHTINNAALTVAGLVYAEGDFELAITRTVMGGLDTDCTGATAGSIMGTLLGAQAVPPAWMEPLGDRMDSYLIGHSKFSAEDVAARFAKLAEQAPGCRA